MAEDDPETLRTRRNRLVSRLILLGFGVLLLVYFVPMVISLFNRA